MFFNKPEAKDTINPLEIAILGTNALGLFLADILQNRGHHITLLCSPKDADEYNATDFVFKDSSRLKNPRNNFHFTYELDVRPQLLFITSAPEHQKADISLLASHKLSNSLIVDLRFPVCDATLSEILQKPIIKGFFEGFINRNKNNVSIFGHSQRIILTQDDTSPEASILKDLFQDAEIPAVFSEDAANNLWTFFGPFLAHALLTTSHSQSIYNLAKTETGRRQIDALLNEITVLATANNASLNSAELLTKLYDYPVGYISPLAKATASKNPIFLDYLSSFLRHKSGRNDSKYPLLHKLLQELYKKY